MTGTLSGRDTGLLRTGGGIDSHAAVTRFLGVRSDRLMDERLPDTGFSQIGGSVRATFAPTTEHAAQSPATRARTRTAPIATTSCSAATATSISELNDLSLDLFTARLEHRRRAGSTSSLTYGLNSQREERVNQGGQGIGHRHHRPRAGAHDVAQRARCRRDASCRAAPR